MKDIYIALGANLSDPRSNFIEALKQLTISGAKVAEVSGLWESPSWPPGQGHPDFLNAAARIEYAGSRTALLKILQDIEAKIGRVRSQRNAPRPLDLDILDFAGQILDNESLTLPHPRMFTRGFVLFPLQQIAPHWRNPVSGDHIETYIARLPLSDVAPMAYRGKFNI